MTEKVRQTLMLNLDIITANNGEEAFNKYVQNYKEIKLIITDI